MVKSGASGQPFIKFNKDTIAALNMNNRVNKIMVKDEINN